MSPLIPDVSVPRFTLTLGGTEISPELKADVVSVEVSEEVDLPAMAAVTLNLWDPVRDAVKEEYFTQFEMSTAVEVAMGLDDPAPLFAGEVTALEPSFGAGDGGDQLTVRAYDRLHRLRFGTHQRTFTERTDSQIASDIANEVGLTPEVEDTEVTHSHVTQDNVSNLRFLMERAKPLNYEVKVEGTSLLFRPARDPEGPAVQLAYRRDLVRFAPRQRTVAEGGTVEVRGWDVKNKQAIVGTAGSGDETSRMGGSQSGAEASSSAFLAATRTITDQPVADADEAQRLARASYNRQQRDFVEAEGECAGLPDLRAGLTIEVVGIGAPFSGVYYVTSATHRIGPDGYRTTFRVRRTGL